MWHKMTDSVQFPSNCNTKACANSVHSRDLNSGTWALSSPSKPCGPLRRRRRKRRSLHSRSLWRRRHRWGRQPSRGSRPWGRACIKIILFKYFDDIFWCFIAGLCLWFSTLAAPAPPLLRRRSTLRVLVVGGGRLLCTGLLLIGGGNRALGS